MRTTLAKLMRRRGNLIAETEYPLGLHGRPKAISVGYWQGQQIHETFGVGDTWAEAVRNCDAQFFCVMPPPATLAEAYALANRLESGKEGA